MLWHQRAQLYSLYWSTTYTISVIELCDVTVLFATDLQKDRHQNCRRPTCTVHNRVSKSHENSMFVGVPKNSKTVV